MDRELRPSLVMRDSVELGSGAGAPRSLQSKTGSGTVSWDYAEEENRSTYNLAASS